MEKHKLNLESVYQYGKYWKNKKVKDVIDQNFYQFRNHINKYPENYDKDVYEYLQEINDKISGYNRQNFSHLKYSRI